MWLDDDTEISNKFIRELILAIKDGYDVIMPKIVGQEGIIYSPNEYGYLKNRLILNKKRAD